MIRETPVVYLMNFHAIFVLSVPSDENRKRNERPAERLDKERNKKDYTKVLQFVEPGHQCFVHFLWPVVVGTVANVRKDDKVDKIVFWLELGLEKLGDWPIDRGEGILVPPEHEHGNLVFDEIGNHLLGSRAGRPRQDGDKGLQGPRRGGWLVDQVHQRRVNALLVPVHLEGRERGGGLRQRKRREGRSWRQESGGRGGGRLTCLKTFSIDSLELNLSKRNCATGRIFKRALINAKMG